MRPTLWRNNGPVWRRSTDARSVWRHRPCRPLYSIYSVLCTPWPSPFLFLFCFFPFVIIILTKKNKKTRTLERKKEKKNIKNFLLLLWLVVAVCVYDILIHEIIGWQPSSRRHWTRKSFPLFIGSALCESLRPAERRAPATSPSAYSFIFLIFSSFPRIVRPLSGITAAANWDRTLSLLSFFLFLYTASKKQYC